MHQLPEFRFSGNDYGYRTIDTCAAAGIFTGNKSNVISRTYGAQISSPCFSPLEPTIAANTRNKKILLFPNWEKLGVVLGLA